jgi:hypothetical protein
MSASAIAQFDMCCEMSASAIAPFDMSTWSRRRWPTYLLSSQSSACQSLRLITGLSAGLSYGQAADQRPFLVHFATLSTTCPWSCKGQCPLHEPGCLVLCRSVLRAHGGNPHLPPPTLQRKHMCTDNLSKCPSKTPTDNIFAEDKEWPHGKFTGSSGSSSLSCRSKLRSTSALPKRERVSLCRIQQPNIRVQITVGCVHRPCTHSDCLEYKCSVVVS